MLCLPVRLSGWFVLGQERQYDSIVMEKNEVSLCIMALISRIVKAPLSSQLYSSIVLFVRTDTAVITFLQFPYANSMLRKK